MDRERIRFIISKYTTSRDWNDDVNIFETLNIDSLDFVKMIVEFETEIGKEIPFEFLTQEKWSTVNMIFSSLLLLENIIVDNYDI